MKTKSLLTAFLCAGVFTLNAQIVVSQWDFAPIGMMVTQTTDTLKTLTPGSINPGPSGVNKTWTFTTLLDHSEDTLIFTNPAWLPSGSTFPAANVALMTGVAGDVAFFNNGPAGIFLEGAYADPFGTGPVAVHFNPAEQVAKFPDTYNNGFQDTSAVDVTIPFTGITGVDSVRFKEVTYKDSKTDGWGTVITPLGSFSCLRHRDLVIKTDSIWAHLIFPPTWVSAGAPTIDTTWHFSWLANGVGFTVVEFDSTAGDTIRNINWLKTLPVIGAVNESASLNNTSVFPNPSAGSFVISGLGAAADMEIYNVVGDVVSRKSISGKEVSIDIDAPSGLYFIKLTSKEGTIVRKLIINK